MSAPDVEKLKRLAAEIADMYRCLGDPDGHELAPDDEGFEEHAYNRCNSDGTEGCLRCMALDALGDQR